MLRFTHCADSALNIDLGEQISRGCTTAVLALERAIMNAAPQGLIETVPAYCTLTVHYDATRTSAAALENLITQLRWQSDDDAAQITMTRRWRIPVCYEPGYAPDLEQVAGFCSCAARQLIELHCESIYYCYTLGFLPGFAYLGDLCDELVLPRRAEPRTRVPAGSVAIADRMTAVYPLSSPGGWHLIGTSPVRFFNAELATPNLISAGDEVQFHPIGEKKFLELRGAVKAGETHGAEVSESQA